MKRHELGLHQWQLAKLMGVGKSTISDWEASCFQPEDEVRNRVITWLGFDPEQQK
jgi:DNA-binding transcriptional regulator YiaG